MKRLEHRHEPLASRPVFLRRVLLYLGFSIGILGVSLGIGILGYHFTEHLSWLDSLLNASMILGGMGPVNPLNTEAGKLFASFYALFAGMVFLVAVGVLLAPVVHRFFHAFHLIPEDPSDEDAKSAEKHPARKR
jgi:hypothetical protein